MIKRALVFICCCLFATGILAQPKKSINKIPETDAGAASARMVELTTPYGIIILKLYDSTPLHRDNFVKLVKQGFYDSLLFHRVIDGFMIQGGDPDSKNAPLDTVQLGNGSVPNVANIPAEIYHNIIHKRGALGMARDDNPARSSSNCQFYIVQGKVFNDQQLNKIQCKILHIDSSFYFNDEQRKTYETIGGAPFLDQNYTVFGEVVKGMEVVDKIAAEKRDGNDRPLKNIIMKMRMLN
jgi:cyclophilin family peptidyl-prolyl cis-trans isomerase